MLSDFSAKVAVPTEGDRLEVFTDGNDDYVYALPTYFGVEHVNYGQLVKIRDERVGLFGKRRE